MVGPWYHQLSSPKTTISVQQGAQLQLEVAVHFGHLVLQEFVEPGKGDTGYRSNGRLFFWGAGGGGGVNRYAPMSVRVSTNVI